MFMKKKSNCTILVVDDVNENLLIVKKILGNIGYDIVTARDGLSALRIVHNQKIDLILLDIMMPGMSGLEVCRYLKVDPKTALIPVIFLTANSDKDTLVKAYKVGGSDYIRKPFFKEELVARVETRLQLRSYEKEFELKVQQRTQALEDTQIQLIYALGGIAEGHSKETYEHVKRVTEFTYQLAILSGMQEEDALLLKDAAALHDIGKLAIPESILHKNGTLTAKEFKVMKTHAVQGAEMLRHSELPLFKAGYIVAKQHHEKWNGKGYPLGIKGVHIHIYGRIVAMADVFDALLFKRAYKDSWSVEDVLSFMREMSGVHFDPKLVEVFFENLDTFLDIYKLHVKKQDIRKKLQVKKKRSILDWLLKSS